LQVSYIPKLHIFLISFSISWVKGQQPC